MNIFTVKAAKSFLVIFFLPMALFGASEMGQVPSTQKIQNAPAEKKTELKTRLIEIKAVDKSTLTTPEKKILQVEKKALKMQAKEYGGIYISVGAIIIILLLLILLL